LQECRRRGISVAYGGSLFSEDDADIAVGLLIDVPRKISTGNRYVTQGLWDNKGYFPLCSKGRIELCINILFLCINLYINWIIDILFLCINPYINWIIDILFLCMIDGCNLFFVKMFKVVSVRRQESWDRWTWKHWPRSCKRARALWLQYLEQLKDQETAKGLEHFGCNILNNSRTKKLQKG